MAATAAAVIGSTRKIGVSDSAAKRSDIPATTENSSTAIATVSNAMKRARRTRRRRLATMAGSVWLRTVPLSRPAVEFIRVAVGKSFIMALFIEEIVPWATARMEYLALNVPAKRYASARRRRRSFASCRVGLVAVNLVNFHERNTGAVIRTAHDSCSSPAPAESGSPVGRD